MDDCTVTGKQQDKTDFKPEFKKQFTIKELGKCNKHLGVWYTWGLDVTAYFLELGMEDFTLGTFEEFKTFQPVSQNSNNPSNARDMSKKE